MSDSPSAAPAAPRLNLGVLAVGLLLTGGLVYVLAAGFGKDPRSFESRLQAAVAFSLPSLDGETVTLSTLQGKPVVLNFWATWCQPCKLEHPHLLAAAQAYQPAGVVFLGVLHEDDPAGARRYLSQAGQAFPTVYDPSGRISVDYGITGVPETFVIDAQGNIARKFVGPVGPGELEAALQELL